MNSAHRNSYISLVSKVQEQVDVLSKDMDIGNDATCLEIAYAASLRFAKGLRMEALHAAASYLSLLRAA